jgi:hypothetical protein
MLDDCQRLILDASALVWWMGVLCLVIGVSLSFLLSKRLWPYSWGDAKGKGEALRFSVPWISAWLAASVLLEGWKRLGGRTELIRACVLEGFLTPRHYKVYYFVAETFTGWLGTVLLTLAIAFVAAFIARVFQRWQLRPLRTPTSRTVGGVL